MKTRSRISAPSGITQFDLEAPIVPLVGAGGITFDSQLEDFEYLITEKFFENSFRPDITFEVDKDYFLFTIKVSQSALQIQFDILTGRINFNCCGKGYKGAFSDTLYPGAEAKDDFFVRNNLAFDLDCYWFNRLPFDGLVVFPPGELRDACWNAGVSLNPYPEFVVTQVMLLDYDYALKHFGSQLRIDQPG